MSPTLIQETTVNECVFAEPFCQIVSALIMSFNFHTIHVVLRVVDV